MAFGVAGRTRSHYPSRNVRTPRHLGATRASWRSTAIAGFATLVLTAVAVLQALPGPMAREKAAELGETDSPEAATEALATMRGEAMSSAGVKYLLARQQIQQMLQQSPIAPGAFDREWESLGPTDVGGRVRALAIDPKNPNVLYAGGIAGGVWKSEDAGASWRPLTETLSNVGVSSIAIDPRDHNVIYVGTGEQLANRTDFEPFSGVGIMKTTDGGATWRILPQTIGVPEFNVVGDIVISAADSNVIYAGVSGGVARSIDAGKSWKIVLRGALPSGCSDLALRTDGSPDILLASCSADSPDGVYLSEDGGDSWKKVISEVAGEPAAFASIAFAPSNQNVAYASVSRTWDSPGGGSGTLALLRSEDGGRTWSRRDDGTVNWLGHCGDAVGQGDYGNAIAVDPTDPNRIWLGGVSGFRSDDGGRTLTIASYWFLDQTTPNLPTLSPWVHADYHAIVFDPRYDGSTDQTVYFATDGGIFRTQNDRASLPNTECRDKPLVREPLSSLNKVLYEPLNHGLSITQFWAGTVSNDGDVLMGGTQDNGTWIRWKGGGPNSWSLAIGGDGFDVAITPSQDLFYGENPGHRGISISRSTTGNLGGFDDITNKIDDTGEFVTPFALDPADPSVLWTGGHFMWRTRDGGDLWVQASPRLDGSYAMSAIGIAPSDSDTVYVGSSSGALFATKDASDSPPDWRRLPVRAGYVSSIAVHPTRPDTAYATVAEFDVPHVLKTTNGGATWTDIGKDLPNVPASSVAINPRDPQMVFVGTDSGVFESHDGGETWFPANGNLTSTIVQDLVFRPGTSELYLFTFGRGAYRVDVGTGNG